MTVDQGVACSRHPRRCTPAAKVDARTLPTGCGQYRADEPLLAPKSIGTTERPRVIGISALVRVGHDPSIDEARRSKWLERSSARSAWRTSFDWNDERRAPLLDLLRGAPEAICGGTRRPTPTISTRCGIDSPGFKEIGARVLERLACFHQSLLAGPQRLSPLELPPSQRLIRQDLWSFRGRCPDALPKARIAPTRRVREFRSTLTSDAWHHRWRSRFNSAAAFDGFRLGCLFLKAPAVVDVRESVAILSGANCKDPATNLTSRRFMA